MTVTYLHERCETCHLWETTRPCLLCSAELCADCYVTHIIYAHPGFEG